MQTLKKEFNALIFGATGLVGFELVKLLLSNPNWASTTIITRRVLDEWKNLDSNLAKKLTIVHRETIEDMDQLEKYPELNKQYDAAFCCLGSVGKLSKEVQLNSDLVLPLTLSKEYV